MTLCIGKILFQSLCRQTNCRFISITPVLLKSSLYDKRFVDPIVDLNELAKPLDPQDPRRYKPVKAAKTDETTTFYFDPKIQLFCNMMMRDGRKEAARKSLDETLATVKRIQIEKYHKSTSEEEKTSLILDPKTILYMAVENCKPVLTIKMIMKGGIRYKVPVACTPDRQQFLSMKWLIGESRKANRRKRIYVKLANELILAANNEGKAVQKKQELHRLCEENRAYAHYRWTE